MLESKTILLIGGAGLLGSEFSRACAKEGARVLIADIDKAKGGALAKEIGGTFEEVDITSPQSVEQLASNIGKVDGIVNAAYPRSKSFGTKFEDAEVGDMLKDIDMHIGANLSIAKYFGPQLSNASVIFLSSIYGVVPPRFDLYEGTDMIGVPPEYAAAKAAIISLSRYFARFHGKKGVRFNAISPGGIAEKQPAAFTKRYSEHLAIGNSLLTPSDVSGTVVFLLSDASKQITGQNIIVDGGWTL
jgi:NAD(P)-dependent dehydrogenase (short-subunit alcohol dehydrogenase family)